MSLSEENVTAKNFQKFYQAIEPYLTKPNTQTTGFTPVGTIISVMSKTAPQFYLACDGSTYAISDYPILATHIKTQFGSYDYFGGDGTTTFGVPDLQGEFLRGTGTNSHTNQGSGANVGEHQDGTILYPVYSNSYGGAQIPPFSYLENTEDFESRTPLDVATISGSNTSHPSWRRGTSRPTNTSVLYCIAYQDIYIELNDDRPIQASMDRWIRFDPSNHKGIIIKAGTSILKSDKSYKTFLYDKKVDFTDTITASDNGKDFFIYLMDDDSVIASTAKISLGGVEIGRFHTLCADAGSNLTMTAPASPSSGLSVGQNYLVKSYKADEDPDFYLFYNKTITAVEVSTPYDVITCEHPLSGYVAGDILPESIFCKTFYPNCLVDDAMVYDKDTDICVDVYLQSGTGFNTRSAYNATHTVSRQPINNAEDFRMIGKELLADNEFTSIALGSNEKTNITGSSDKTTVGGHTDTSGRRMISAIGCEECCGYIFQWLKNVAPVGGSSWVTTDGKASFGQEYGESYVLGAGGSWTYGAFCGSRSRTSDNHRSDMGAAMGGRGCTKIIRSANAPKNSLVPQQVNYSTSEQIVGTWIDGKPIYQKTIIVTPFNMTGDTWYETGLNATTNTIYDLINCIGYANGSVFPLMAMIDSNNQNIVIMHNRKSNAMTIFKFTIQYTKTTD